MGPNISWIRTWTSKSFTSSKFIRIILTIDSSLVAFYIFVKNPTTKKIQNVKIIIEIAIAKWFSCGISKRLWSHFAKSSNLSKISQKCISQSVKSTMNIVEGKKISRVLYRPLSKYLPRRAKWAKKRIVQKCECNIFLSKVLRSKVGTKELFFHNFIFNGNFSKRAWLNMY